MEETINLKDLLQTLKKRLNLILTITLLAILVSGVISYFFLTPIYQSSTQLLVNQSKNEQTMYNYNEVQTNLQLINTYNVIIKSPAILDLVIKELKLDMSTGELNNKVTVASEKNSQVVNISVQDPNAKRAANIANKTAEVFTREISQIMNVDNVSILAKAQVGEKQSPIKPKPLLNIAIALVVGLMAGVGLAFLLEYFDNTIKTEQDIEKLLGMPVLGVITTITESRDMDKRADRNARA
ncbi:Wzz/FepE/Etk N-terminal domain-containing protein [Mesobacillus subterraneus]|uniref:YveK family protein n=1 Tax=Mesobacillus subterraneus TaxID=285983 RepID=UPI00203B9561|nr:Wzz/FepE/Etk N-terminal domain-containing protein [Mesobacillus subterraneus]MCM3663658.1 Wzz/FepE/Etk N-terminal domain-containing protein [Mesobacillus subterraneus]MCM3683423.1 Wzz/FepE/Etk N-terminal domain-containing protein [Mesobacillus subterraneus]